MFKIILPIILIGATGFLVACGDGSSQNQAKKNTPFEKCKSDYLRVYHSMGQGFMEADRSSNTKCVIERERIKNGVISHYGP